MYQIIRKILFYFDPEKVHHFAVKSMRILLRIPGMKPLWKRRYAISDSRLEREFFGLKFPNPVGLAAGFDKNGDFCDDLVYCGFGHIEIGTVTPKRQPGNEKPRLFRLISDDAIINRMGFNSDGLEAVIENLKRRNSKCIIGGNIGKNTATPSEQYTEDYLACFRNLHPHVDYFVLNVSCPNVSSHAKLEDAEYLRELISAVQEYNELQDVKRPVLLKIAPDLNNYQLDEIVELAQEGNIEGLITTNTTVRREGLNTSQEELERIGNGGLSGKPLKERSTEVIRYLSGKLNKSIPIIGVGGIQSPEDALEKMEAGADLVQIYTGFIYEGPRLVKRINKAILNADLNS